MSSYGYEAALEAAGATVIAFQSFGSYQGDWLALVEVNGQRGWIMGSYGSCSGCDAFEAEFGYDYDGPDYQERLCNFGQVYLDTIYTKEEAIAHIDRSWYDDDGEMTKFIEGHS